jgi:hypothetical protein
MAIDSNVQTYSLSPRGRGLGRGGEIGVFHPFPQPSFHPLPLPLPSREREMPIADVRDSTHPHPNLPPEGEGAIVLWNIF